MSDNQKPKRRVNPALLLGGDSVEKKSQPSLVDAENFPKKVTHNSFRPELGAKKVPSPVLPSPAVPVPKSVVPPKTVLPSSSVPVKKDVREGLKLPSSTVPVKKKDAVEDAVEDALPVSDKKVSPAVPVVRPFQPNLPRATVPKPVVKKPENDVKGGVKGDGLPSADAVSTPESVSGSVDAVTKKDDKVSPDGDKVRRMVNPLFLAGEEKEHIDTAIAGKPDRVMRPNFILQGDKIPANRVPKRPEKPGATPFQALPEGEAKERSQYSRKIEANVEFEEWGDDDSTDTQYGLGGEFDASYVEPQFSRAFHLTERDIIVMRFLSRYRYAYTDQLARLVDTMPRTIAARLRVLEKRGFVRKEAITERQFLWTTRKAGNLIVDINFPEIRKGSISYATIAHTIGLGNLGVEFEREMGGKDLLGEGKGLVDFELPENRWKLGVWGNPEGKTVGEMTVTEREIRQGQLRWRGGRSSKEMRDLVTIAAGSSLAPELEEGQEGLFVIYGAGGKGGEHIPDMVVARDRDENGKSQHIAIELELTPKSNPDWRKILRNYRDNGEMYSKVYYFTHKRAISTALQKVNEEVGLENLVIRKYTPVNGKMPFWG